jgi:hypothetical protein
VNH